MKKKKKLLFSIPFPASQVALMLKNSPASAGQVRDLCCIPGSEDALEEGMATHISILAWKIPRTEEPGGLQSMGLPEVGHDGANDTHTLVFGQTPPGSTLTSLPPFLVRAGQATHAGWVRRTAPPLGYTPEQ